MGRKIPGTKHHGVRDPEKQKAERLKKLKTKINAPPTNADEQSIPKSLLRLQELRDKVKSGDFARKRPKSERSKKHKMFQQLPGEPKRDFMKRVNSICETVKREAAFENRYGVDIKRDDSGEVTVVKRPQDPVKLMLKEARKEKKKKRKSKEGEVKLTKPQKWRRKLAEKKKDKELRKGMDGFKTEDKVEFGEQLHEPPTLTLPRGVKDSGGARRPGQKNLVLKTILNGGSEAKSVDRTGKRKDLPNALRRQLDRQHEEVVQAYKLLKSKRWKVT